MVKYLPQEILPGNLINRLWYQHGVDWLTRLFPWADHHDLAWRSRLHIALRFLFEKNQ